MKHTYAIHTMGCKLNSYDSEVIAEALEKKGFEPAKDIDVASLVVINTCTVTGKSDAEARHIFRKVKRRNPDCFLAVTGCYAQSDMNTIRAMPEVDFVSNNVNKYRVDPIVDAYHQEHRPQELQGDIGEQVVADFEFLHRIRAKTRAFVKIQDGCAYRCAFCIVPSVRGPSRSVGQETILDQLRILASEGIAEAVLTGIHIGSWGQDFRPKKHFVDLLQAIEDAKLDMWIRLSSLESTELTDAVIDVMINSAVIVPHVHLPLQSGCNTTLRRMNRRHTTDNFFQRVHILKSTLPDLCIGADIIVGFPGETDDEFEKTRQFLETLALDYLHVFPYSPRKGTTAAEMEGHIDPKIIRQRAASLRRMSTDMRGAFIKRHLKTTRSAIVLPKPLSGKTRSALTDNYIQVAIDAPHWTVGKRVEIRLDDMCENHACGSLIEPKKGSQP